MKNTIYSQLTIPLVCVAICACQREPGRTTTFRHKLPAGEAQALVPLVPDASKALLCSAVPMQHGTQTVVRLTATPVGFSAPAINAERPCMLYTSQSYTTFYCDVAITGLARMADPQHGPQVERIAFTYNVVNWRYTNWVCSVTAAMQDGTNVWSYVQSKHLGHATNGRPMQVNLGEKLCPQVWATPTTMGRVIVNAVLSMQCSRNGQKVAPAVSVVSAHGESATNEAIGSYG